MDTQDQFKRAEEEYSRLKSQLAAGQITQPQFDAAIRKLIVKDDQGRAWTLGDNGYWNVQQTPTEPPPVQDVPRQTPIAPELPRTRYVVPLVAAGCLVLLCLFVAGGLIVASNLPIFKVAQVPTATAIAVLAPTVVLETPTETATAVPATATATFTLAAPTAAPLATATIVVTPTAVIPPGVYVTGLRVEPVVPVRRQDVTFFPTFLNTSGATVNYRWLVYIFKLEVQKNSLGETPSIVAGIPVGQGEQIPGGGWRLTGGGGCEEFVARVAWLDSAKKPTFFNKPDGSLFESKFSVC
ncbi:MAG: hypothetical protein HY782_06740 [Chloroflexi bacterium]|nr:hypothetical protein [Chloroflexota bacterium]